MNSNYGYMHNYCSNFGYIQTYALTDVDVFLVCVKLTSFSILQNYASTDAVAPKVNAFHPIQCGKFLSESNLN